MYRVTKEEDLSFYRLLHVLDCLRVCITILDVNAANLPLLLWLAPTYSWY